MMDSDNRSDLQAQLRQAGTTYPRVINLPGRVRERVNHVIRETALAAIPEYDPGTPVIEAQSGYKTPLNQKGILSLRFEDYFYPEQAAHGVTGVSSVTIDLRTGHVYDFDDLFHAYSNYQAALTRIIQAQIANGQITMLKPFGGVGTDESYYLTPDSLVIYYQPYVYTPGYAGVLEFTVPYQQIMEYIDPRGPIGRLVYYGQYQVGSTRR